MLATWSAPEVEASLHGRPAVGIAELDRVAALRRRFDAKHLVRLESLGRLLEALPHFAVLQVDGRRATTYRTVYFDDDQLRTYRDHVQGRRLRYKIRTRRYEDGPAVLELKRRGGDGATVKRRWPHPVGDAYELPAAASQLVDEELAAAGIRPRQGVSTAVAETSYQRVTLVDLAGGERVTIDLGLQVAAGGVAERLGTGHAIVEAKSRSLRGGAREALVGLGIRPEPISKYGLAVTATRAEVRGNRWLPALRRLRSSAA